MGRKPTFTNVQLVLAWKAAFEAEPRGTRRDVVVSLMEQAGMDVNDVDLYNKMYSNVTQRVKALTKSSADTETPIVFGELAPGSRGRRANANTVAELAALMTA